MLFIFPASGKEQTEAGDGLLHSYELYQLGSLRARLVVLSACRTGTGRFWQGEGVMSLTRPFFSAGVPTLVASLWDVNESDVAELMVKFHRYRRQNGWTAAQSLRAAQLDALQAQSSSRSGNFTWAAFVVIGSAVYN
jgi:CHAT domain-containing protein